MTDITVIKMIISVAVWRIYPSWVNDKLWAWEELSHSGMFWARLSRDDFRSKLEIISFPSGVMSVSKSFLFPALLKDLAPNVQALGLLVSTMFWGSFWKLRSVTGHLFANSYYDHKYFLKISFLFSKAEPVLLAWQLWRSQVWAKHFGDGTSKTRMKTRLPGFGEIERRRTIDRRRDWYKSCAMIHGPEEKKKHKEVSVWLCEGSTLHHLQTSEFWGACFRDPTSLSFRTSLFSWTWMYSCRTVRLQRRTAKKSRERERKRYTITRVVLGGTPVGCLLAYNSC